MFVNHDLYPNGFEEAVLYQNGVVGVSILFQEDDTTPSLFSNNALNEWTKMIDTIYESFVPLKPYFTYKGSLTYPPCFNTITWIVFEDQLLIQNKEVVVKNVYKNR